jgi:outer membrane lipoprotein
MKLYLLVITLLLTACSSLPPALKDPPAFDLSYPQAISNLDKFKNMPVRWGGKIVEVENEANFSALQILAYPLDSDAYPRLDGTGYGRFVVKSATLLDPAVYTKEALVTVAGNLEGGVERTIGNAKVTLPAVALQQIHLWQPRQDYYDRFYGGFGYGYGGGFGYPYGGFYGYDPYYPGAFYGYSPYFRGGGYYAPYRNYRRR